MTSSTRSTICHFLFGTALIVLTVACNDGDNTCMEPSISISPTDTELVISMPNIILQEAEEVILVWESLSAVDVDTAISLEDYKELSTMVLFNNRWEPIPSTSAQGGFHSFSARRWIIVDGEDLRPFATSGSSQLTIKLEFTADGIPHILEGTFDYVECDSFSNKVTDRSDCRFYPSGYEMGHEQGVICK